MGPFRNWKLTRGQRKITEVVNVQESQHVFIQINPCVQSPISFRESSRGTYDANLLYLNVTPRHNVIVKERERDRRRETKGETRRHRKKKGGERLMLLTELSYKDWL